MLTLALERQVAKKKDRPEKRTWCYYGGQKRVTSGPKKKGASGCKARAWTN